MYRFPESERKGLRQKENVEELWAKWLEKLEKPEVPGVGVLKRYRAFATDLEPKVPYENPLK